MIPDRPGSSIAAGNPEFDLVVGVTSTGPEDCTDTSPTIYTSIGAFWEWIQYKIGEVPEVNCSLHLLVSDRLAQERHLQNHVEPSSPEEGEGTRTPQTERPTEKETGKELSEKQLSQKERKRLKELSQNKLIKVALVVR